MVFERFTRSNRNHRPMASIWSRGQICLNKTAVESFDVRKYKFAILFYDKATRRIGIQFTNNTQEKGIAIMTMTNRTCALISAVSFLDHYKIDYRKTQAYPIVHDKESHLYVISVNESDG